MNQSEAKADFYKTDEDLIRLVQQFEACTLPRSDWNHAAHLTIAVWYLARYSKTEAIARIRTGIQHYNQCNGIVTTANSGYHETLTLFWIAIACRFITTHHHPSISALSNDFISIYGERKTLFYEYYSHELIMSWEARQSWVTPDLKSLDEIS